MQANEVDFTWVDPRERAESAAWIAVALEDGDYDPYGYATREAAHTAAGALADHAMVWGVFARDAWDAFGELEPYEPKQQPTALYWFGARFTPDVMPYQAGSDATHVRAVAETANLLAITRNAWQNTPPNVDDETFYALRQSYEIANAAHEAALDAARAAGTLQSPGAV